MKKTLALLLCLVIVLSMTACGSKKAEPTEITVFAAASMTEALTEIKGAYEAENRGVTVTCNFDSSGTLKTQIQEGAVCDLFISAAQKQMNALDVSCDAEKNPDGLDFVLQGSRVDLLENKVALVVPEGNPKNINSFDELAAALRDGEILMAMGNEDVPVGQYTQKILAFYGLSEEELAAAGKITYGSNVKEVTTQVKEGSVDCGVVYCTDATSAGLTIRDTATKEMCGQIIYPAAVMKNSANIQAAQAFLDFVAVGAGKDILSKYGFSPLG